ncbi:laminin subunit alpha-like [Hetaerina americana]|uniref:laminin subunit alpha-like n=1 Tax=Hetaerina americana TaxID=62018 RepID=UPI003A7F30FD
MCDQCKAGRYGYPNCVMCNCSIQGSSSVECDSYGNCSCNPNYFGSKCDQCNHGYYNYPSCIECKCNSMGSTGMSCDGNGKCSCKPDFDGMQCNKCKLGYYGFPNCTACNCDPKGVTKGSIGCELQPNGELCPCKKNVKGRLCDECKEHHWNLTASNPEGCEDCNCYKSGVVGHTGKCDPHTGKCPCKYLVKSHKCQKCRDGTFNLRADNLLGCSDCECNVGGSVNRSCDDTTGQCHCKPNVEGQRCSNAVDGYYFPTFHQFKFEAEEGRASNDDAIQYSFNKTEFPGYSWKGYVAFSDLQNQLTIHLEIDKQNMYQVIFHCLNIEENPIKVTVTLTPEGATSGSKKTSQVMIQPSKKPLFITVMGSFRNLTSPILWATGKWSISVRTDSHLFLDYVVIIPMDYYEATALTHIVNNPCAIQEYKKGEFKICRHFCYPKVSHFKMALGKSESYARSMLPLGDCSDDEKILETVKFNFSLAESQNHDMKLKLELSKHGEYVLVLIYHTPGNNSSAFDMSIETSSSKGKHFGKTTLHPCNYSSPCRQVIQDESEKIKIFNFSKKDINVLLTWKGKGFLEIISIVALSHNKWSLGYIEPKPACVKANGKCLPATVNNIPHSKKIHLASVLMQKKTRTLPYGLTDSKSPLIHLDIKDEIINLKGNSSPPGKYAFVLHYYQPDYPGKL